MKTHNKARSKTHSGVCYFRCDFRCEFCGGVRPAIPQCFLGLAAPPNIRWNTRSTHRFKTPSHARREAESDGADAERAPNRARLTDRDRQLIGMLAVARYLSNEQLATLFFLGRNPVTMRKRTAPHSFRQMTLATLLMSDQRVTSARSPSSPRWLQPLPPFSNLRPHLRGDRARRRTLDFPSASSVGCNVPSNSRAGGRRLPNH